MKVCIGLSGGVDSSVAALLLKQQGYDVFAMFMQNWHDADATLHGDCEWEEDRFVAELVARKIGIPFYFVDLSKTYRQKVVDYMFEEYARGRTPNPDVLCNREIKFDAFWEVARKYGADFVATGHYVRKEEFSGQAGDDGKGCEAGEKGSDDICPDRESAEASVPAATDSATPVIYRILEGSDPNKDQSYFLCQLSQEQLAKALFPIGHLTKPEVRRIAAEAGLPSADKKDSQGICFVGKVDLPTFLRQKLESVEGDVVEVFDAYYDNDPHFRFLCETISALRLDGTAEMTAPFHPEIKFITRDGEPLGPTPYDEALLAALPDETLLRLATPLHYYLHFETETYRSGKKHVRKTRWKPHPGGAIVGRHEGAQFYTVGQRKGLGIGGHRESLFVLETDIAANRIYVGEGQGHRGLYRHCVRIAPDEVHWIRTDLAMQPGEMRRYRVRARYRQPLQGATLLCRGNGLFILFDQPQRGLAPGQFAVWYDGEEMLGSGVI